MKNEQKIRTLVKIAHPLNAAGITWAVGGSMLLYLKGITKVFKDIDIVVMEEDAQAVKAILQQMGMLEPSKTCAQYRTKAFFEFSIDGVDVDVLAGFVIVKDGIAYDCALQESDIAEHRQLYNESIPLHAVSVWRNYYELMGKPDKVQMIDDAFGRHEKPSFL